MFNFEKSKSRVKLICPTRTGRQTAPHRRTWNPDFVPMEMFGFAQQIWRDHAVVWSTTVFK
ncbi:hypothetical protein TRM7557_01632 [Tritonibacter multivorans]|uniref:Uncharacterized protein n=1 Tax=Tritonibacter multivorans TaxID=928856 RepID=A0A0P1G905_9RHOB|nr:hypothetical protein TRM7557_01632 [Tritonibacter multivorans]SFD10445.1 hypothetical protein SAMN04488049_10715 [Tritonibacter multivorans]